MKRFLFIALLGIPLFLIPISMQASDAGDLEKYEKKLAAWSAESELKTKKKIRATTDFSEDVPPEVQLGIVLNTIMNFTQVAGFEGEVADRINASLYMYNIMVSGQMQYYAGHLARELLPDESKKYFDMCYLKEKIKGPSYFDPCDLLNLGLDPCEPLPELADWGFKKNVMNLEDTETLLADFTGYNIPVGDNLVAMCRKLAAGKSLDESLAKTTTRDKISNYDPTRQLYFQQKSTGMTAVRATIDNSNITSVEALTGLDIKAAE